MTLATVGNTQLSITFENKYIFDHPVSVRGFERIMKYKHKISKKYF